VSLREELKKRKQFSKELSLMKKTVAVDLDGVLAQYNGWKGIEHIGDPIEGAKEFIETLLENFVVLIHTTRCSQTSNQGYTEFELYQYIQNWLDKHKFPHGIEIWTREGKPIATAYVDDRAVSCVPQVDPLAFTNALEWVQDLAK
jgi:hypothetical protein